MRRFSCGHVVQEVERRQGLMKSAHTKSLREWNAKFPADRLPYIVVVVDEFAQFRAADAPQNSQERKGRQAVAALWQEIGRTGRALGVHVIACTQRPDAETITPQLKAQFPGKVAFFCTDDMNSRVILDDAAAAALPPPWLTRGRAVWKGEASDLVEFQVPYLSDEEAVRLLSARYASRVVERGFGADAEVAGAESEEEAA